ncbi:helix-turn-helix domain-containing protein [Victivallis sp. Marseille-Q1083]|uniref:helix-turn-helix domain-containing protein n=1 Tax=Victivallis sp. Marseille-Q1083 TaxID=2717288 RepID=UPI0034C6559D
MKAASVINCTEIGKIVGAHRNTVGKWISRWKKSGTVARQDFVWNRNTSPNLGGVLETLGICAAKTS